MASLTFPHMRIATERGIVIRMHPEETGENDGSSTKNYRLFERAL